MRLRRNGRFEAQYSEHDRSLLHPIGGDNMDSDLHSGGVSFSDSGLWFTRNVLRSFCCYECYWRRTFRRQELLGNDWRKEYRIGLSIGSLMTLS